MPRQSRYNTRTVLVKSVQMINKLLSQSKISEKTANYGRSRLSSGKKSVRLNLLSMRKQGSSSRRSRRRPKMTLTKEVANLKRQVNAQNATYTKKARFFKTCSSAAVNEVCYESLDFNSASVLEGVIDAVKYFDPATPGTLINVDLSSPTFQNQVRFVKSYGRVMCRSNYGVPCKVDIYVFKAKLDTGITVETALSNGLTDSSNGTSTSPLIYPSDSHDVSDLFSIVKHKTCYLPPGGECILTHSFPAFNYDVSLTDSHTSAYQRYFHGSQMVVRVSGVIAHGATSGVTLSRAGVDITFERMHTVKYPAGVNTRYLEIDDNPDTAVGQVQMTILDVENGVYA